MELQFETRYDDEDDKETKCRKDAVDAWSLWDKLLVSTSQNTIKAHFAAWSVPSCSEVRVKVRP